MTLTFTLSNGQTFEAKNVKVSDQVKVEYIDKDGNKVIKYIIVTPNLKIAMI